MLQSFNNFQDSTANFEMDLFGENVGEKIYEEIIKML